MSDNMVCFNPDLLAGYDDRAIAYQEAVDQLTGGFLPDDFDPCLEADEVPASFVINGFNPENTDEIQEYVKFRPYYQTRAELATRWIRLGHDDVPWPPEPANIVDREGWERAPIGAIRKTASLPDRSVGAATFAFLLSSFPQTDRTLAAMEAYLGLDDEHLAPGADFSLLQAYRMAQGDDLKAKIAVDLLERFEKNWFTFYDHPKGLRGESVALWREWTAELVPIFIALHQKASDNSHLEKRFAEALVNIESDEALEYLTGRVLSDPTRDGGALDALLSYRNRGPEVAPFLARILEAPVSSSTKERILEAVVLDGVAPHWRLARVVARSVVRNPNSNDTDLRGKINYIAFASADPVADLSPIVTSVSNSADADNARIFAFEALTRIETPAAQKKVREIIRGLDRVTARSSDPESLRSEILSSLIQNSSEAAHETALSLLGSPETPPETRRLLVQHLGSFNSRPMAFRFFRKACELSRDGDKRVAREAADSRKRLAEKFFEGFSEHLQEMSPEEQELLANEGGVFVRGALDRWNYRLLISSPFLAPQVRTTLEEQALVFFTTNSSGTDTEFLMGKQYPAKLKDRFVDYVAEITVNGIQRVIDISSNDRLPLSIRRRAVLALGRRTVPTESPLEEILVANIVLNNELPIEIRLAGMEALKERAGEPESRAAARRALARLLPVPATISTRASQVLKGL